MSNADSLTTAIGQIPWHSLRWSYLSCSHAEIQFLLSELFHPDRSCRQAAADRLENQCAVQGALSEAAFYLIPLIGEGIRRHPLQSNAALSLLINVASSFAARYLDQVTFSTQEEGFTFFLPAEKGCHLFLDHACRMALAATAPFIVTQFQHLSAPAQVEAVSFIATLHPEFATQWMLDLKKTSPSLPPEISNEVDVWLADPVFQKIACELEA